MHPSLFEFVTDDLDYLSAVYYIYVAARSCIDSYVRGYILLRTSEIMLPHIFNVFKMTHSIFMLPFQNICSELYLHYVGVSFCIDSKCDNNYLLLILMLQKLSYLFYLLHTNEIIHVINTRIIHCIQNYIIFLNLYTLICQSVQF